MKPSDSPSNEVPISTAEDAHSFRVAGLQMKRIWHCFGNYMHHVDLWTVQRMLRASGTNVLPINTHRLTSTNLEDGLEIGFGGVTLARLREARSLDGLVLMLNINHQTSARAAVAKTELAHRLTNQRVLKLEVLNEDLRTSNDAQLIEAVRELRRCMPELIVMPLLSNDLAVAQQLVELGCPLLRVMGSGIGSGRGITDPEVFARICRLPVPVVLDGGVATAADFAGAWAAGAQGCLINSALFATSTAPDEVLETFARDCERIIDSAAPAPISGRLASNCRPTREVRLVRGSGSELWDEKGRRYFDLSSQTMNMLLGQCNVEVGDAIHRQLRTLTFVDQDFPHALYDQAIAALAPNLPPQLSVYNLRMNDGSSAVECAVKQARRVRKRGRVLTFDGIYLGQNAQSLHLRGWGARRTELLYGSSEDVVFAPVPRPNFEVPVERAADETGLTACAMIEEQHDSLACVVLDPVMVSSGVSMGRCMPTLLRSVIACARKHEVPVIVDECQTFGWVPDGTVSRHLGLEPDIIVLGKSVGGGLPLSVCVARPEFDGLAWGDADYTNGGTLAAIVGLITTCRILARPETHARARAIEAEIDAACEVLRGRVGEKIATRGLGLIRAIQLRLDSGSEVAAAAASRISEQCLARGVIVRRHTDCLTLKPSVLADPAEVRAALGIVVNTIIEDVSQ